MNEATGIIAILLALCLATAGTGAIAAPGDLVEDQAVLSELQTGTLRPYFDALVTGDVAAIRAMLTDDEYAQYKTLFEQNARYEQFLRDYYNGTTFQVSEIVETAAGYRGTIRVHWPDGTAMTMTLDLIETGLAGGLKIAPQ